ncbi:MAG TPA: hypothetical protein VJ327_09225 [Patescibacteria group bacterium]|nr:hypothetical protein [Patescibacteria group bacterium]
MDERKVVFAKDLGKTGSGEAREFLREPEKVVRWAYWILGLAALAAVAASQFVR